MYIDKNERLYQINEVILSVIIYYTELFSKIFVNINKAKHIEIFYSTTHPHFNNSSTDA